MFNQVCMFINLLKISPPVSLFGTDFYSGQTSIRDTSSIQSTVFVVNTVPNESYRFWVDLPLEDHV